VRAHQVRTGHQRTQRELSGAIAHRERRAVAHGRDDHAVERLAALVEDDAGDDAGGRGGDAGDLRGRRVGDGTREHLRAGHTGSHFTKEQQKRRDGETPGEAHES
jgi:hypothetical protein